MRVQKVNLEQYISLWGTVVTYNAKKGCQRVMSALDNQKPVDKSVNSTQEKKLT